MDLDIKWAAGLFEGEGSIFINNSYKNSNGRAYKRMTLGLKMTDLDVLESFQQVVGCGKIYNAHSYTGEKQKWNWNLSKRREIIELMTKLLPYLHERRREKYYECLGYRPD